MSVIIGIVIDCTRKQIFSMRSFICLLLNESFVTILIDETKKKE